MSNRLWVVALLTTVACGPAADGTGFGSASSDDGSTSSGSSSSSGSTSAAPDAGQASATSTTSATTTTTATSTSATSTSTTSASTTSATTTASSATTTSATTSSTTTTGNGCVLSPVSSQSWCQTQAPIVWLQCSVPPGGYCEPIAGAGNYCCTCEATNNVPNFAPCAAY